MLLGGKISSVQVISKTNSGVRILSLGPLQGIPKGSLGNRLAESSTLRHQHIWRRDGMRYKGLKKIEMGGLGGEEASSKTDITSQKTK